MSVTGAGERIRAELDDWHGIMSAPHQFGGVEFKLGSREIGHIHGDSLVDVPLPKRLRDVGRFGRGRTAPCAATLGLGQRAPERPKRHRSSTTHPGGARSKSRGNKGSGEQDTTMSAVQTTGTLKVPLQTTRRDSTAIKWKFESKRAADDLGTPCFDYLAARDQRPRICRRSRGAVRFGSWEGVKPPHNSLDRHVLWIR